MKKYFFILSGILYQYTVKPVLFLFDPLTVHVQITRIGQWMGKFLPVRKFLEFLFCFKDKRLEQTYFGLTFENPVGLAAGYDYEARLTGVLSSVGFGFGSVGTLTFSPYGGNPPPLLGRLPKSKSLMVNKGFKNDGVEETLKRLNGSSFSYPVGVSIGATNNEHIDTLERAIQDILSGFNKAEASHVPFSYYELNISCPNLKSRVDMYKTENLNALLSAVEKLSLSRPVFVKMPISKSDTEILEMVHVIVKHPFVKAVILGNLQLDRNNPALRKEEVERFSVGNWSGMACQSRSDELIKLVFNRFGDKIKIIGCGGIFSAEDAYRKLTFGASLVQLVTGLIFEGPQVIASINHGILERMRKEGRESISEVIGSGAR